jgi:hypothetical protein
MRRVPVVFPSEEVWQQAWNLMRKTTGINFITIGYYDGKDVLGFTPDKIELFRQAEVPFKIVDRREISMEASY